MSAERLLPSSPGPPRRKSPLIPATLACVLSAACNSVTVYHPAVTAWAPTGGIVAFARQHLPCPGGSCWSLWLGPSMEDAALVQDLAEGEECTEIAWTKDGRRVAFLIDGYQLRIYDAATRAGAGQVNLLEPGASPPGRIARGVTFSENGRAVTFDECPRERSGCRAGLAAVPW